MIKIAREEGLIVFVHLFDPTPSVEEIAKWEAYQKVKGV